MADYQQCASCVDTEGFEGLSIRSETFGGVIETILDSSSSFKQLIDMASSVKLPSGLSDEDRIEFESMRQNAREALDSVQEPSQSLVGFVMQCQITMQEVEAQANATDCSLAQELGICPRVELVNAALDEMTRGLANKS